MKPLSSMSAILEGILFNFAAWLCFVPTSTRFAGIICYFRINERKGVIDALGKRIARLRHKVGLSQARLADRLGISASAIGMYEQGRREPPLDTIVLMSMVFGVTTDYLLTGHIRTDQDFAVAIDYNREKYWKLIASLLAENGSDM